MSQLPNSDILYAKTLATAMDKGVKLVYKETWFWKLLNYLTIAITFGKNTTFLLAITTIGKTIAVPRHWDLYSSQTKLEILVHELVHVAQYKRLTVPGFFFIYLLFPLPIGLAFFRYKLEREAYAAEFRVAVAAGADREALIDDVVEQMAGPGYTWAWPFRKSVRAYFEKAVPATI